MDDLCLWVQELQQECSLKDSQGFNTAFLEGSWHVHGFFFCNHVVVTLDVHVLFIRALPNSIYSTSHQQSSYIHSTNHQWPSFIHSTNHQWPSSIEEEEKGIVYRNGGNTQSLMITQLLSRISHRDKVWTKDPCLSVFDRTVLRSPEGMLTDLHIHAVQKLLKQEFPELLGLQSPVYG